MCKCNASINGLHVLVMFEQDGNGQIGLFWGIAADGSVVISENLELNKARCAKSFAPFPTGIFISLSK
jgi:hypothetical protein